MYFIDWVVWGRIKYIIILDDLFDDFVGFVDLILEKFFELKFLVDVMFICFCVFFLFCLFGCKNFVYSRLLFLNG